MAWHAQFINKTLKTHGNADCVTKTNFPIVYTVRFVCKLCSHISRSADLSQTGHFQVIHMEPGVRQWPDQKQELPFVQNKTMDQHSSLWLRITMGQCPSRSRKKKNLSLVQSDSQPKTVTKVYIWSLPPSTQPNSPGSHGVQTTLSPPMAYTACEKQPVLPFSVFFSFYFFSFFFLHFIYLYTFCNSLKALFTDSNCHTVRIYGKIWNYHGSCKGWRIYLS